MVSKSILVSAAVAAVAQAANHQVKAVDIGFEPNEVQAAVGDTVEFIFTASVHDVINGDFNKPCMPVASGGFNSGFLVGASTDSPSFTITVTSTDPIPFYCSVATHCKSGMVGIINPAGDVTAANFQKAASGFSGQSGTPDGAPFGGVSGKASSSDDSAPASTNTETSSGKPSSAASPSPSASATSASSAGGSLYGPGPTTGAAGVLHASVLTLAAMLGTAFLLI